MKKEGRGKREKGRGKKEEGRKRRDKQKMKNILLFFYLAILNQF